MVEFVVNLSQQRRYWALLVLLGIALEGAALYYQYVLDEWPCVLCIQVRIWVVSFILLGLLALFFTGSKVAMRIFHGISVIIMIGLLERSWRVLAVERGWIFGDCEMDLGMPAWFALDKWFPWIFEVQTSCGYTPLILFDISVAEVLLVSSVFLTLTTAALFVASWFDNYS
ncbi:MAG: disulfide bond formation protein B [Gammaproteobacteria bacterium]|nr:disulfide bond formation protein B [Gammaproteobacteria bacterium]MDH3447679.1 disulfide bond formation protein B [Gammaproteobacteria bacterium]